MPMKKLIETLKTMTFKEAVDYIWEYYKIHIIGGVLIIAFLVSILSNIFKDTPPQYNVMVVAPIAYEQIEVLQDGLNKDHFDDFEVAVDYIFHQGGSLGQQAPEQVQKLVARIAVGMVDIMVVEKDYGLELLEQEGLRPISEFVDIEKLEQEGVALDKFGTDQFYGIGTNHLDVFNDVEGFEDKWIVVVRNGEMMDKTPEFFETLLE